MIVAQSAVQRCNATVDFLTNQKPLFPPTVNDGNLHNFFENIAGEMLGTDKVKHMQPLMGSEDFSFYQEAIPGYFMFLGMKNQKEEKPASPHSPFFKINEDALPLGAALHASLATRFLLETHSETPFKKQSFHDEL